MGYTEIQHMPIYEESLTSVQKRLDIINKFIEDIEGTENINLRNIFVDKKERCEEVINAYQTILREMNR